MQLYERITYFAEKMGQSRAGMAKILASAIGKTQRSVESYFCEKSEHNLWPLLPIILREFPRLSRHWLYFGEGPMMIGFGTPLDQPVPPKAIIKAAEELAAETRGTTSDLLRYILGLPRQEEHGASPPAAPLPPQQPTRTLPLRGFANCGIEGWGGSMTLSVSVSFPGFNEKMIAVVASGDSMLPAGIGNGQICYCDPDCEPTIGEPVFVQQKNGQGAIKLFMGRGVGEGKKLGSDSVALQGWLARAEDGTQKPFTLFLAGNYIETLAPVVLVRRRL